jgi:hypothetical protein
MGKLYALYSRCFTELRYRNYTPKSERGKKLYRTNEVFCETLHLNYRGRLVAEGM